MITGALLVSLEINIIMGNIVSHFTERGVKAYAVLQKPEDVLHDEMPWWAVVLLALHIVPYFFLSTMVGCTQIPPEIIT